jgi:hypothetical protein
MRSRSLLAGGGELLLERRQFGEGRIGIDRALALARWRAGRILPVRRAAAGTPAVAIAFRLAGEFALVSAVAGLALKTLAGRTAFFLARDRRRGFGGNDRACALNRRIAAPSAATGCVPSCGRGRS